MIRMLGSPVGPVYLPNLQTEAAAALPKILGVNAINGGTQYGFYFNDPDAPAQSAIDSIMAAHNSTPPPDPLVADKQRLRDYMPSSGSATASAVSAYIADATKDPATRATMAALRSVIRVLAGLS